MMTAQDLIQPDGTVALDTLLNQLRLTRTELEHTLGIPRGSWSKRSQLMSTASQHRLRLRLRDFVEILVAVAPWAGSLPQALAWFTAQPLPSFGDQTAADLLREGRADVVKCYISRIATGGYA